MDKEIGVGKLASHTTAINKIGFTQAKIRAAANFGLKDTRLQTPVDASLSKLILPDNGVSPWCLCAKSYSYTRKIKPSDL